MVCSMCIVPVQGMCLGAQAGNPSSCCIKALLIEVQCDFTMFAQDDSRSPLLKLL
jgi:hypothetical protein